MKHIFLTISLILFTNTLAATSLSIKHTKKLPRPHDLITKGKILDKFRSEKGNGLIYWIAWDKTNDIYFCHLSTRINDIIRFADSTSDCYLTIQETYPEEVKDK